MVMECASGAVKLASSSTRGDLEVCEAESGVAVFGDLVKRDAAEVHASGGDNVDHVIGAVAFILAPLHRVVAQHGEAKLLHELIARLEGSLTDSERTAYGVGPVGLVGHFREVLHDLLRACSLIGAEVEPQQDASGYQHQGQDGCINAEGQAKAAAFPFGPLVLGVDHTDTLTLGRQVLFGHCLTARLLAALTGLRGTGARAVRVRAGLAQLLGVGGRTGAAPASAGRGAGSCTGSGSGSLLRGCG